MHDGSIVIANPQPAAQLVLLFHGVGSSADNLVPVGRAIAQARPHAFVVSVGAAHPSTLGSGREWFSVVGITEENRPERIAKAMPLFRRAVRHWQEASGIGPAGTVLLGFSQGAIMSLESTQADAELPPAQRVIAIAGRFAQTVRRAPQDLMFHLIHGEQDGVVPARFSADAARQLQGAGAEVTLDLLPGLGHGIDERALGLAVGYLGAAARP
jgi:phospholipase/carboxylesterase